MDQHTGCCHTTPSASYAEGTTMRRADGSYGRLSTETNEGPSSDNSNVDMVSVKPNMGPYNAMGDREQANKPKTDTRFPHTIKQRDHATAGGDGVPQQADGGPHSDVCMAAPRQLKQTAKEVTKQSR